MLHFQGIEYAPFLHELHTLGFAKPWSLASFQQILSLPSTFGFCTEKGFILCSDLADDIEILTFTVHPRYRQKGLGKSLLQHLQQYAIRHKKKHIFLEVNQQNNAALSLYLKQGFQQTGCRKNYYHEGETTVDALCLEWENPQLNTEDSGST